MDTAALHVMVLPLPAQGHVTPLMELSHRLDDHGFEVTFVCTEPVINAMRQTTTHDDRKIHLVSIPDGMADGDDRKDLGKVLDALSRCVSGYVEDLIGKTKVKWLVADTNMGALCFEVAKKLGVRVASFFPASAACLGTLFRVPKLIEDGFFDDKGFPKRRGEFELAPKMPPIYTSHMVWSVEGGPEVQHAAFQLVCRNNQASSLAEITVCNSFLEAEAMAFELFPNILPIGPLFADQRKPVGQFLPEDTRCLSWLDGHPDNSVVYVAFGTSTVFDPRQFKELAEGLELTGRPFLWVVRPDFTSGAGVSKAWFEEFENRVAGRGMVVSWCSQQQVLAHRAVACFVSHCGWNSTMEGVRNGMPFLCWSRLKVDQYTNRSYVCDIWRTGLAVSPSEDGVVTKEEVSAKVEHVIGDHGIANRARILGDAARSTLGEGGSSHENFNRFIGLLME
ncbi:UDP-glycosyltransferase 83A1-like [Lolium rigidum]|uniref:UDP-glycosyltransferase 83A1-like n=1 Tax=Lolium rigidum TaxID=89674 RepID=UPI001F5C3DD3|nr:UDP-glycosyltransferase 83A1-like [Lolium rigidum]